LLEVGENCSSMVTQGGAIVNVGPDDGAEASPQALTTLQCRGCPAVEITRSVQRRLSVGDVLATDARRS
jgi:hypothetical protein